MKVPTLVLLLVGLVVASANSESLARFGKTIPLHIPTQIVTVNDTFEVPYWLGAYYATVEVSSAWTLPLTIGNGGQTYPGEFLIVRNYGPEDILLYTQSPETIEGATFLRIPAGSVTQILSGYPNWVVTTVPNVDQNVTADNLDTCTLTAGGPYTTGLPQLCGDTRLGRLRLGVDLPGANGQEFDPTQSSFLQTALLTQTTPNAYASMFTVHGIYNSPTVPQAMTSQINFHIKTVVPTVIALAGIRLEIMQLFNSTNITRVAWDRKIFATGDGFALNNRYISRFEFYSPQITNLGLRTSIDILRYYTLELHSATPVSTLQAHHCPGGSGPTALNSCFSSGEATGATINAILHLNSNSATCGAGIVAGTAGDTCQYRGAANRWTGSAGVDWYSESGHFCAGTGCTAMSATNVGVYDSAVRVVRSCTAGAGITCSVTDGVITVAASIDLHAENDSLKKRVDLLESQMAKMSKLLQLAYPEF